MICHNPGGQMSCQKGWFLVDALRENPFHMSLLASGVKNPWCPLAFRYVIQSLSLPSHHLPCAISPPLLRTPSLD